MTSPICRASSLVGTMIMLLMPRDRLLLFLRWIRSMRGMAKAAVLPVPVWATARTSSPFRIEGMALNWMSVGRLKPSFSRLFFMSWDMWYFSNFMGCCFWGFGW